MKNKAILGFLAGFIFLAIAKAVPNTTGVYPTYGIASYYTAKSCKQEGTSGVWTASGQRYNEYALTCATRDKSLFGRYIKVMNIENGKSVTVLVNDFGPNKKLFRRGRIIDLSKGAFGKIADLKKGLIRVKLKIQTSEL